VSEITNEDIDAVTDPEVCALADAIVLGNQGCGNASVLIDRFATKVRQAARERALDEAAEVAEGNRTDDDSMWDRAAETITRMIRKLKEG